MRESNLALVPERITPEKIAREIDDLMAILRLKTTVEMAALLRNPGDDYPSDGLIRTMRLGRQMPSGKFVKLLRARRREVDDQLQAGLQALEIGDQIIGVYHVTPKRHLHPILLAADLEGENVKGSMESLPEILAASLSVPHEWVGSCVVCGRPFLRRSTQSKYCYRVNENGVNECRREAARRARKARKETSAGSNGP